MNVSVLEMEIGAMMMKNFFPEKAHRNVARKDARRSLG